MSTVPAAELGQHTLQCMEIWGGNEAVESAVSVTGIDAWVYSRPHGGSTAGGDVHYVSLCGGGKIARFALVDVAGHGQSVSELAGVLRGLMRKYINRVDQAGFAKALNREFTALAQMGAFATAVLTAYFAPSDHLVILNAGHPPPFWYRAATGTWQALEPQTPARVTSLGNLPLGIIQPTDYRQFAVQLEPHDLVLMYTDALNEAADPSGTLLGIDGLLRAVSGLDASRPESLCGRLLDAVNAWRGGLPAQDDVSILLLHHNASAPKAWSAGEAVRVFAKMLGLMRV